MKKLLLLLILLPLTVLGQKLKVSGTVTDNNGIPLGGATIVEKGTENGTVSDFDGNFKLTLNSAESRLIVSYMGFDKKELKASPEPMTIVLSPNPAALDEILIVGYGTQKREKVTGAVSQVGSEVFENRPLTNVAQGLQGTIPNLNITFNDGEPNRGGTFNLRGFTSINGGSPLILIDGTPGDINLLSPEDIRSVTVLKDAASAAIYGARAAFGVVLVTTKDPKNGKAHIRFTSNYGWGKPTRVPEILDNSLEAAKITNLAYNGFRGKDAPNMNDIIDYLQQRQEDPSLPELGVDASGNFIPGASINWYDEFYNDYAPFTKNYFSLSGKEGKTGYFLSLGYQTQEGIFKVATDEYKRSNLRLKLDNQTTDWLNLYDNVEFGKGVYDRPNKIVTEGGYSVYRYLSLNGHPYNAIKTANGNYTQEGMTTFGQLEKGGRTIENDQMLKNTIGFKTKFFDNKLRINGDYSVFVRQGRDNIQYNQLEYEKKQDQIVQWNNPDYYRSAFNENLHQTINLYSEYEQTFNNHHLKALIGFNQELFQSNRFSARRDNNLSPDYHSLNLTSGDPQVGDNKYEWALRGYFGRLNYDYKGRYLVQLNSRYDATSRFPKDDRWGYFPSISAGWVISDEPFLKNIFDNSTFKLRGSYGSLGNQQVSPYAYINSMSVGLTNVLLDGEPQLYTSAPGLTSQNLTWETTSTLNVGFDFSFFQERLNGGFDWYKRKTKDMLTKGMTLPAVLGTGEPQENAANLETKGWELSLGWNDQIGNGDSPFSYYAKFVLSDSRSFITKFDNPNKFLGDYYEGMEIGEIWGLNTLGFFQSDDEYLDHADQSKVQGIVYDFSGDGHPLAGDLKFEDLNKDGVIDLGENTVDNPGDRHIIGNSSPRYAFGFNTGFSWKNFSVDVFLQGIGKRDFWPGSESAVFWGFYNRWNQPVMKHIAGNYWTPDNPNAYFPRPRAYEAFNNTRSLGVIQTRYLQDASYLRLKNLTIGYTVPTMWTEKISLKNVRLFFSGSNLFEITNLSKAFDPEGLDEDPDAGRSNGNGFIYPLQRTYTFGLELNL